MIIDIAKLLEYDDKIRIMKEKSKHVADGEICFYYGDIIMTQKTFDLIKRMAV